MSCASPERGAGRRGIKKAKSGGKRLKNKSEKEVGVMDLVQIARIAEVVLVSLAVVTVVILEVIACYALFNQDKIKPEAWLTRADKRKRRKALREEKKQAEIERKKWEAIYAKYAD